MTGQLTSLTYPSGNAILYTYDADGRVSALSQKSTWGIVTPPLNINKITYQPFGPVASWQQGNSETYTRTYDQDGRVAGLVLPATTRSQSLAMPRAASLGISDSAVPAKSFGYDALGRITGYVGGTTTQTCRVDKATSRMVIC